MPKALRVFLLCSLLSVPFLSFSPAHAATFVNGTIGQPCLDVRGAKVSTGTNNVPVQPSSCNGAFSQQWNFEGFTIQGLGSTASGGHCLDVLLRSTADGTLVEITDCNGTPAQTWVYLGGTLVNTNSNKCLTAGALGTQLTIQTCNGTAGQFWSIRS